MKKEDIKFLLRIYFPDGFRAKSARDLLLLRNYAEEEKIKLSEDDEELRSMITSSGLMLEGMIFIIHNKFNRLISRAIQKIKDEDLRIVFYEPLMKLNRENLNIEHIFSVELFRDLLRNIDNNLILKDKFFTFKDLSEQEAIVSEIKRVFENDEVILLDEIFRRLIYIPSENIKSCLEKSGEFVKISESKFFLMDKFVISEEERIDIFNFVKSRCEADGFISIVNIPCESVKEKNYELTGNSIYTAIFNAVLKGDFHVRNKIITQNGKNININEILKNFCRDKSTCSIDEVAELYESITGKASMTEILKALYESMIRLDEKNFIADELVSFDVDEIDKALQNIIADKKFISLQSIITFATFPDCGQSWNYFLLESFCLRFSRKFSLRLSSFNNSNIGIITEKNIALSYDEILAKVLVREKIKLTEESAGKFLFENGYTGRAKFNGLREIIKIIM